MEEFESIWNPDGSVNWQYVHAWFWLIAMFALIGVVVGLWFS